MYVTSYYIRYSFGCFGENLSEFIQHHRRISIDKLFLRDLLKPFVYIDLFPMLIEQSKKPRLSFYRKNFYKPDGFTDDEDDIIEVNAINAEDVGDNAELITFQIEEGDTDSDAELFDGGETDTDNDSDMDSDSTTEEDTTTNNANQNAAGRSDMRSPENPDENDDEDDVVQAIIAATKTVRAHPPDIVTEEFIVDLSFHPTEDILAVGTITGDVIIYKYSNEENQLMNNIEVHTKAVRDIEFNWDGSTLFSVSKDKSIMMSDITTGKLKRFYDNAHESPIYKMHVVDENLFATGTLSRI